MKNFKLLKFLTVLSLSCPLLAQKSTYIWPLDSSLALTGNYGEIRSNHFHTGIDLSTNGREGLPVQAIADGTVSRIRISSGGYGRCVYIRHDNGQVSVYAHLSAFNTEIHEALFTEINKRQVYELDLTAPAEALRIRQGQIIGYSGNSGSSTGPHLHFEIRDDKTEIPYNPLLF
jgi:murein DD-endopeptidase MepM/ murein hydrolase activator NlpD